jgi:hypothetical protein
MENHPPPPSQLVGVPLEVAGTKSLTARWKAEIAPTALPQSDLVVREGIPNGEFTNTLRYPMVRCLLIFGEYAIPIGRLEPGQSAEIDFQRIRHNLNLLVTGSEDVFQQLQHVERQGGTYNQKVTAAPYVLRAMLFYHAAGGPRFTGLHHRYQSFVDLSDLLPTGRAVLLTTIEMPTNSSDSNPAPLAALRCRQDLSSDESPGVFPGDRHLMMRFILPIREAAPEEDGSGTARFENNP